MLKKIRIVFRLVWLHCKCFKRAKFSGIQDIPIHSEVRIEQEGMLELGNHVSSMGKITLSVVGGNLVIDDNTGFNRNCIIVCHSQIHIGSHCHFGPNIVIYDHDHAFNAKGIIDGEYKTGEIIVENNCWIGANVTILRGTHIGEGSVIGAGTVVKGNIPPHSIVTSNRELIIHNIIEKE